MNISHYFLKGKLDWNSRVGSLLVLFIVCLLAAASLALSATGSDAKSQVEDVYEAFLRRSISGE